MDTINDVQQNMIDQLNQAARNADTRVTQFVIHSDSAVKALLPRGRQIMLKYDAGSDLYTLQVYKVRGTDFWSSEIFEGVYFDMIEQFMTNNNDGNFTKNDFDSMMDVN